MPSLDPESDSFVLRIVYDGPSEAGKTTTVRRLAEQLGVEAVTPQEVRGRTLYFDWMEYHGGRYEGRALRCQVLTVPGQMALEARRLRLLRDADVVVLVVDSTREGCEQALPHLKELRALPDLGNRYLIQANKRDRRDALPLDEIRRRLNLPSGIAISPTIAENAQRTRETFVLAVRLALEQIGSPFEDRPLGSFDPRSSDPTQLLEELQRLDLGPSEPRSVTTARGEPPRRSEASTTAPPLPDALVPLGHIWPPGSARALLVDAAETKAELIRWHDGTWGAEAPPWSYRSHPSSLYGECQAGRQQLVVWARWHALMSSLLSSERALVLSGAEEERSWRLWQVVRRHRTLEQELLAAVNGHDETRRRELLRGARRWLHRASEDPQAGPLVRWARLDRLAWIGHEVAYCALCPEPAEDEPIDPSESYLAEQLRLHSGETSEPTSPSEA